MAWKERVQKETALKNRQWFIVLLFALLAGAQMSCAQERRAGGIAGARDRHTVRVPVIDVTDLYFPHDPPSDLGDNFDLVNAYALPEIDLKAVILDVSSEARNSSHDIGVIPVAQLNYIFGRNVPFAAGPFTRMRSLDDKMLDAPAFQQQGVKLLLKTLRESPVPVTIVSFGSLRAIAVAYNRDPALFRAKVAAIHISAGNALSADSPGAADLRTAIPRIEWNVWLDPLALARLLRSDLPIAIYPCAAAKADSDVKRQDPDFALTAHNSHWLLPSLNFASRMDPRLQNYLGFTFSRAVRMDILRSMDTGLSVAESAAAASACTKSYDVWETAIWIAVSKRALVRHQDGSYEIVPAADVKPTDQPLKNDLVRCGIKVTDDGRFVFDLSRGAGSNFRIYDRGDAQLNQTALQEALPRLYESYVSPGRQDGGREAQK